MPWWSGKKNENSGWKPYKDWSQEEKDRHEKMVDKINATQTPEKEAQRRGNVADKITDKKNSPSNQQS